MALNADEDRRGGSSSLGIGVSERLMRVTARCSNGTFPEGICGPGPRDDGGNRPEAYRVLKEGGGDGVAFLAVSCVSDTNGTLDFGDGGVRKLGAYSEEGLAGSKSTKFEGGVTISLSELANDKRAYEASLVPLKL
jgi:hypothetical protein